MIWQAIIRKVTRNKLEAKSYEKWEKFVEKNNLRMKNDARLLVNLIYLNYKHSNGKSINIKYIYKNCILLLIIQNQMKKK